jgi:Protein of unknown function (DUF2878)
MLIANFLLFQLAWFSCVVSAAYGTPWSGVAVTIMIMAWHLSKIRPLKSEIWLLFIAIAIGACFDQLMLMMQWIVYQNHGWSDALVPVWILALWCAFASTLNVSLVWLQGRYLMAILLGAIAGPIAYLGAERIGAVTLTGEVSYIALSIGWALLTPLLLYIAKYLNQFKVVRIL